ncbi:DUF2779 domain-containing protein [Chloroflexota bacterium]
MLTKTKYLNGLQCLKYLWILFNEPERVPGVDARTQYVFDQGHVVGELAKELFAGGVNIPQAGFMENLRLTREYLKRRVPVFEAGVRAENIYARADILRPSGNYGWDILEVKSSTSVKDVNLEDMAFQRYVYQLAGLEIDGSYVVYINNGYVKNGQINPAELFTVQDITEEERLASVGIQERIEKTVAAATQPQCPETSIGAHCKNPYECPITECWAGLPEDNVFTLYRGGKKSAELYENGVASIAGIPESYALNPKQEIQRACAVSGQPFIEKGAISEFLAGLKYPLYYLDFETFTTAVPIFDGTRPFQNIPFQFSLHVQSAHGSGAWHFSFLADGEHDFRGELLSVLHNELGDSGTIVAYNASFEKKVIEELGQAFPDYAAWSEAVNRRFTDLMVPFRNFDYYSPDQKGSASMKNVLPAVTGKSYKGMEIARGDDASIAFLGCNFGQMPEDERREIRQNLLDYCGLDTEGMVWIVEKLREVAGN